jgi:hypothetical protein
MANGRPAVLGGIGLALSALVGCGGGGDDAPAPSANRPPAFTSMATATVAENSGGTVYTATASDLDGNPLTFSIAGGPDAARFNLTAGGALSFAAPPDFEDPTDADRNNSYVVQLAVSDGTATATLDLTVSVTNVGPDNFVVRRVGAGFSQPLYLAPVPGDANRVFVVEKGGRIRLLTPATGAIAATCRARSPPTASAASWASPPRPTSRRAALSTST